MAQRQNPRPHPSDTPLTLSTSSHRPGLVAQEAEVVAGKVIRWHVVVGAPLAPRCLCAIAPVRQAATRRGEIGDCDDHRSAGPRDACHLRKRGFRRVEVIQRTLAKGRVEHVVPEGQRIRPGPHPPGQCRPASLRQETSEVGHPLRGFRSDGAGTECIAVLSETSGDIEDPPHPGTREQGPHHLCHSFEEKQAIDPEILGNHIAHVSIEVAHKHVETLARRGRADKIRAYTTRAQALRRAPRSSPRSHGLAITVETPAA